MMSKKPVTKMGKGATLIAENTAIAGDVRFSDQLYVNGHIEGNVLAEAGTDATLMISDVGSVKGQIHAPFVVVNGRVEGDVHAGTRVELAPHARISGNVYYTLIEMQLGANGRRPVGACSR
jgi:cytoskeletal protein CcmA (bactofilin family)